MDESSVKNELNLDALSVQVRVVGAMSIYRGDVCESDRWLTSSGRCESAVKETATFVEGW